MTNFVLIYTGGTTPDNDADVASVMAAWGAWYAAMGEAVVDGGNPFGASKHVSSDGTGDGPVGSPAATGYTVIAAESLDAAVASVQNHPHLNDGGQISVYETFQM